MRYGILLTLLVAFVGCGVIPPLPEGSLDPIPQPGKTEKVTGSNEEMSPRTAVLSPMEEATKATGTEVWVGRYRDSRGEGEIMFSLVRRETTLYGIWKFRTGGGGPVKGIVGADGETLLAFRMENTAPECPGLFTGHGKVGRRVISAVYEGKDCQGPVSDGRLELGLK